MLSRQTRKNLEYVTMTIHDVLDYGSFDHDAPVNSMSSADQLTKLGAALDILKSAVEQAKHELR